MYIHTYTHMDIYIECIYIYIYIQELFKNYEFKKGNRDQTVL